MKISSQLTIIASVLITAGCAHHDKQAQSRYQNYPPSYYSTSGTTDASQTPSSTYSSQTPGSTAAEYQGNQFKNRGGTDQSLVMQVQDAINKDTTTATFAPRIEVTAQNGTVTLAGSVPTDQDKQRIESMVKKTAGVVSVNNQLDVSLQPTSDRTGQSSRLYQDAKDSTAVSSSQTPSSSQSALGQNSLPGSTSETEPAKTDTSTSTDTSKSQLSSTDQGTTPGATVTSTNSTLSTPSAGTSPSGVSPTSQPGTPSRIYTTNQTSTTGTSDQTGISDQSTLNLNIQGTTEIDRTLGQKVMQELRTDATLAGQISAVRLSVDNGKITLRGTAKSEDQKKSIESAVQRVTGVTTVDNQIQVGTNPTSSTSDTDPNK